MKIKLNIYVFKIIVYKLTFILAYLYNLAICYYNFVIACLV